MSRGLAILNLCDTGAAESTAHMLETVGYEVRRPDHALTALLRVCGLENVLDSGAMRRDWGYEEPRVPATAAPADMARATLFIDTKAHVNYGRITAGWPSLAGRVLWCCLNGGDPLRRADGLPWADPPCPVLTNNQWYEYTHHCKECGFHCRLKPSEDGTTPDPRTAVSLCNCGRGSYPTGWAGRTYVCYPPYRRLHEVPPRDGPPAGGYGPPMCLVHNVARWGYGALVPNLRGEPWRVRFCGGGDGNDALLSHADAMRELARAACLVHLKTGDTVGYAVVEAMACGVPVVCTRFYISETRLGRLLEPGVTCMTFDPTISAAFGADLTALLERLGDPAKNVMTGLTGRERLLTLQWDTAADGPGFARFMSENFPPK